MSRPSPGPWLREEKARLGLDPLWLPWMSPRSVPLEALALPGHSPHALFRGSARQSTACGEDCPQTVLTPCSDSPHCLPSLSCTWWFKLLPTAKVTSGPGPLVPRTGFLLVPSCSAAPSPPPRSPGPSPAAPPHTGPRPWESGITGALGPRVPAEISHRLGHLLATVLSLDPPGEGGSSLVVWGLPWDPLYTVGVSGVKPAKGLRFYVWIRLAPGSLLHSGHS